ncbi:TlpA family protein disulfide reductase [Mariniluteicoccus flavus]
MGTRSPSPTQSRGGELSPLARILALVVVVAVLVGGFVLAQRLRGGDASAAPVAAGDAHLPRVGEMAPDFTARTTTGEQVSLSGLRGKPVWVTFGASWCAGCRAEAPDIEQTYRDSREAGVQVLAVYLSEDAQAVQAYAGKLGMTYHQIPDPNATVSNLYGARAVPMHVFVGPDGRVKRVHAGILTPEGMREAVGQLRA